MTDIEQKALALLNEPHSPYQYEVGDHPVRILARAIEQHEQFKRQVSDAVEVWKDMHDYLMNWSGHFPAKTPHPTVALFRGREVPSFDRFILPKPVDPLVAVMDDFMSMDGGCLEECVEQFRVALAKRGLQISEVQP